MRVTMLACWIGMVVACACAGKTRRDDKERPAMAKPSNPASPSATPPSPPFAGFSYPLTGSTAGAVMVDPTATHLDILSSSSKNPWDQHYRVRASVETLQGRPVLRCQVRPNENDDATEILLGGAQSGAPRTFALKNDAGTAWGKLTTDGQSLHLTDADGHMLVEVTAAGPAGAGEGIGLVGEKGAVAFRARVVTPQGTSVTAGTVLQP